MNDANRNDWNVAALLPQSTNVEFVSKRLQYLWLDADNAGEFRISEITPLLPMYLLL